MESSDNLEKDNETLPKISVVADDVTRDQQCVDPYFYTRGKEFTSEIFKIELMNLPNFVGYAQLKKLLENKLELKPHKIKVIGRSPPTIFVTFRCEDDREMALRVLTNYQWKGRTIHAKKANPSADPLVKKRKEEEATDGPLTKIQKTMDHQQSLEIRLKEAVAPLWDIPYPEQLQQKQKAMQEVLIKFGRQLQKTNPELAGQLRIKTKEGAFCCCDLLPIRPSPAVDGYRNKCEFNVGLHPESGAKTVGFRIGSYKEGSKCVVPPVGLPNVPRSMLSAAECFEEYVRNSEREVFNPETNEGHWRQLTVRIAGSHTMLIVGMHPQDLTAEELSKEKVLLRDYFGVGGAGTHCSPTSLYFQTMKRKVSEDNNAPELLWGDERMEERIVGMRFLVSPNAFFQINTPAAEVLYSAVAEMALADAETSVVDLCCGTGAIGLSLAGLCRRVVGIEMCEQAVDDARLNAQINGIKNAEFICGRAEEALYDVLRRLAGDPSVVAVVDPPRAGLHGKVIKCIRGAESLRRLIYVSCNPSAAVANFIDLCRPTSNSYRGRPFVPVRALPVDLFPHTRHCEIVILFERQSS